MTTYTYSIQNNTLNQKVNSNSLTREILLSAIVTSLDHINTAGDQLDVVFKADLSQGDKTILDSLVSAHKGIAFNNIPLVTYKVSPNILSGTWSDPWVVTPMQGYKLSVVRTMLVVDPLADLSSKTANFIITKTGDDGSITATRPYAKLTDYITKQMTFQSVKGFDVYTWNYTPNSQEDSSIVLRSSQSASISLSFPGGVWDCSNQNTPYASLTLVCISQLE